MKRDQFNTSDSEYQSYIDPLSELIGANISPDASTCGPLDHMNARLIEAGAALHWLAAGQKYPIAKAWSTAARATESDLRRNYRPGQNIGLRLGQPSQIDGLFLHVVDLDIRDPDQSADAWAALLDLWPAANSYPSVVSGSSGQSRHLYFLANRPYRFKKLAHSDGFKMAFDPAKGREVKKSDWEIDLLGTGRQVVLPPSTHPDTGKQYRWERPLDLDFTLAMLIDDQSLTRFSASEQQDESNGRPVARLETVNPKHLGRLLETLNVEDREDWCNIGMALHHEYAGSDEGFEIWNGWAKASSKFKLKDSLTVWKSFKSERPNAKGLKQMFREARIEGYGWWPIEYDWAEEFDDLPELPEDSVAALNRDHAAVMIGGKFRIVRESAESFEVFSPEELHKLNANKRVKVPRRDATEPVTAAWMRHPSRRTHAGGLVFNPKETPEGSFNIWRGWAVQPAPDASCDLFLDHVRGVICKGAEREYLWLVGWMAHLVQHPEQKPGTAVVLRGVKGAGKDTFGDYLGKLLGRRHHVKIAQPDHLTGRFNAHLENGLLLHLEEGFWAGDKAGGGVLKNLITCPTLQIERKGIDPYEIDHFARLLITSNEEWVVPATPGERRYFVLDVAPERAKDTAYFGAIWNELRNGGAGALLHFLQCYDLSGFDVRNPPETAALTGQKLAGLRNVDRWWYDLLSEGDLWRGDGFEEASEVRPITVPRNKLRRGYEEWLEGQRWQGEAVSSGEFGKRLRTLCSGLEDRKQRVSGGREWQYILPPLADCRASFETHIGGQMEWEP